MAHFLSVSYNIKAVKLRDDVKKRRTLIEEKALTLATFNRNCADRDERT
jgi:hypothetical protein